MEGGQQLGNASKPVADGNYGEEDCLAGALGQQHFAQSFDGGPAGVAQVRFVERGCGSFEVLERG